MVLALVLLALVLAVSGGEIKCVVREREALLRFKKDVTDNNGVLSSWGSGEECCKWKGVRCSNSTGHVTGIILQGDHSNTYGIGGSIGGNISSSLVELQFLEHLDLSSNDFIEIPIPSFFGSFENLRILNLQWSSFSGMIPPQLGNLTNLRRLDLSFNSIWSENLDWLSHLKLLSELDLGVATINDSNWLYSVLKLRSLQELSLHGCSLKDVTPSSRLFVNSSLLQSLSVVDLSNNRLTSSTFDWLFNLSTSLTNINLNNNQLEGPIPYSFGRFIFLEILRLFRNQLTGGVPKSIGSLSRLKHLDLSGNKLTWPVSSSLGNLSELEYLDLGDNSLQGILSESHFMKLHRLKYLSLSYNSLTLHIPPSWIPPFQLGGILLASCNMGPSFPTWLQTQTSFSDLDISNASISDRLPEWLWSLSPMVYSLNISSNQLRGSIPDLSFFFIRMIDASYNQLSGLIPLLHPNTSVVQFSNNLFSSISSICYVSYNSLAQLDLSNNELVGALPNCWKNMTELRILNLSNNKLSGEIPKSLGSLLNLKVLRLRGNNFSGDLPSALKNCGGLVLIDIGDNNLIGEIPPWLASSMSYLILRGNRFHGGIPHEICSLTGIELLDLSRNNISGNLPHCFHNFTSLATKGDTIASRMTIPVGSEFAVQIVNDAIVQWKRQEEAYFRLGLLRLVDLSSNRLIGNIPASFSTLRGLMSLNLSRNHLSGSIDSHIGQMEMLEILDLSRNQLSGEIPTGLAQLSYLAVLDLADNKLSGKIPSGTQLQTFNESAYSGNDGLCGLPLKPCEADTNSGGEKSDEEEDGEPIGLSFMQEVGISMAFGFILGFWGVVGSFVVKRSWRDAFLGSLDSTADWIYVSTILVLTKFKRRMN